MEFNRIQHLLPDAHRVARLAAFGRFPHLLPSFARNPKRAAAAVCLIGGVAAGPIAGAATASTSGSPDSASADPAITHVLGGGPTAAPSAVAAPGQTAAPGPTAAPGSTAASGPAAALSPTAAPSPTQLMPDGVPSPDTQSNIDLDGAQVDNAHAIVAAAQSMHLPPRAAVIAVATSMQESKLMNLGNLGGVNDHDSLGLFQQRPSSGWGTPDELTNPTYASDAFLRALTQVPDWQSLPLTDAAQAVQVSAFGDRYAQWEKQASDLVLSSYHTGPYAHAG